MSMRKVFVRILPAALGLALVACGPQGAAPPQVLSFYPPDGYHGFRRGEAVAIAFSEPMDAAATEAAFQLLDPHGAPVAVTFTWEDGGRRLRAAPTDPVAYSPDDQYLNYRYLLSTGARSQQGVALEAGLDVTFSTLRTLTVVRDSVAALDGAVSARGFVYNDPNDPSLYTTARTGDTAADIGVRSFFAFDLNGLTFDPSDVAFARLSLYNNAVYGAPFGPAALGNLIPERVEYLDDGSLDAGDYAAEAAAGADPVVAWPTGEAVEVAVGDWVRSAMSAGDRYLQVRLRFEQESDNDGNEDSVNPTTGEHGDRPPRLEIGHYAP
ncbi:Ig-like domain-containing protein [Oceanithermus profundus]